MIQQIKWTERKFDLEQPIGMFPITLERLRGTPARLYDMLKELPAARLIRKDGAQWSIQEHAGHLLDIEELHDGRIDDFITGAAILRAADMTNKKTYLADHNNAKIENLLEAFKMSRMAFVQRLEKLDESALQNRALHPRLNVMIQPHQMAIFIAEHDDQHIAIMRTLINQ